MTEQQLREQLDAVYASTSWKITAPLRFCASMLRSGAVTGNLRFSLKKLILSAMRRASGQPRLRRFAQRIFLRFPNLKRQIQLAILSGNQNGSVANAPVFQIANNEQMMTPAARTILQKLRTAINDTK